MCVVCACVCVPGMLSTCHVHSRVALHLVSAHVGAIGVSALGHCDLADKRSICIFYTMFSLLPCGGFVLELFCWARVTIHDARTLVGACESRVDQSLELQLFVVATFAECFILLYGFQQSRAGASVASGSR